MSMSSALVRNIHLLHQTSPSLYNHTNDHHSYLPTPQSFSDYPYRDPTTLSQTASAYQQQQVHPGSQHCMHNQQQQPVQFATTHPHIRIQSSSPLPPAVHDGRQDSVFSGHTVDGQEWQRSYGMSMGVGPAQTTLKRARSHQRTPSASTVGSNGPASPYTANSYDPRIANTDISPNSHPQYADQAYSSKDCAAPQQGSADNAFWISGYYIPSQAAHSNAHLAMKSFALDHHQTDEYPEFYASSHPSMSSHGNNTPTTPQSGLGGDNGEGKPYNQNDARQLSSIPSTLFRTESSQAYEAELYNPSTTYTSTPARRPTEYLTPHRNLVTERLQTAEAARSASPQAAMRERSPFRDGSPLAPVGDWNTPHLATAASMRQQRKLEAEQAEIAAHKPTLRREPTKTMSPQDALLEYNDTEQQPLFQDSAPAGYAQHGGGTEAWQSNFAGSTFGNMAAFPASQQPQMTSFRATSADTDFTAYSSMPLPPVSQDQPQLQGTPFHAQNYPTPKLNYPDVNANPEFPAHITSMESSVSDNAPPVSSQDSFNRPAVPTRPADTRANTGTYTCTYHGCAQRFDSHNSLQKHKRDFHRAQQLQQQQQEKERVSATPAEEESGPGSASASASARSTASPDPSGEDGLSSAALLARNSQAGPHKCTRINPSTNKPCNTIFSRPYDLTRHEDTIHNNRKQKVKCPMCREEKTFSRNDALTRHMRVVHPEVESFGKRGARH